MPHAAAAADAVAAGWVVVVVVVVVVAAAVADAGSSILPAECTNIRSNWTAWRFAPPFFSKDSGQFNPFNPVEWIHYLRIGGNQHGGGSVRRCRMDGRSWKRR